MNNMYLEFAEHKRRKAKCAKWRWMWLFRGNYGVHLSIINTGCTWMLRDVRDNPPVNAMQPRNSRVDSISKKTTTRMSYVNTEQLEAKV